MPGDGDAKLIDRRGVRIDRVQDAGAGIFQNLQRHGGQVGDRSCGEPALPLKGQRNLSPAIKNALHKPPLPGMQRPRPVNGAGPQNGHRDGGAPEQFLLQRDFPGGIRGGAGRGRWMSFGDRHPHHRNAVRTRLIESPPLVVAIHADRGHDDEGVDVFLNG